MKSDVRVPEELFVDILPAIGDMAELKAIARVAFITAKQDSATVSLQTLLEADTMRGIVGLDSPESAETRLRRALDRAVADGALLRLTVHGQGPSYALATDRNRRLIEDLRAGEEQAATELGLPDSGEVSIYRPNVFALYERLLGPLTPLVAERLRDAERSYPRRWLEAAMDEAVRYNKRNWRYVETILARWEEIGGPDEAYGRRA